MFVALKAKDESYLTLKFSVFVILGLEECVKLYMLMIGRRILGVTISRTLNFEVLLISWQDFQ